MAASSSCSFSFSSSEAWGRWGGRFEDEEENEDEHDLGLRIVEEASPEFLSEGAGARAF